MNILDIFYKNIVQEATNGRIDCFNYYNIIFSTKIIEENKEFVAKLDNEDIFIPTLIIKNKKEFDSLLIEYVNKAMIFYDDYNFDNEVLDHKLYDDEKRICKEKIILALLFSNATTDDFNDPCNFLRNRINFMDNDVISFCDYGYCDILHGNLSVEVKKDIINNETPYQMIIKTTSENGDDFTFPKIKFSISNDFVYIYAIQNKEQENTAFNKKINRVLYKIGEGYTEDNENSTESLKDVTSSFLVSLNIGVAYLYSIGYKNIIVPSFLIERWNAKCIANSFKIKYKSLDDASAKDIFVKQEYIQQNLTNKLIRTFLRLGCHFNNIDVSSLPYEIDSCLHIYINDRKVQCNNKLLGETYEQVFNSTLNKKNKK